MDLIETFKSVVEELEKLQIHFALAGGVLSSIYRKGARATQDIDFAVLTSKPEIEKIIRKLNLKPHYLRMADLKGGPQFAIKNKSTPICIIAGRNNEQVGLDFILPELPWVEEAVKRAQSNKIDFGFGKIPSLTIEDFIISKIYSFQNNSTRFLDLDDLKEVFLSDAELQVDYLLGSMNQQSLKFPDQIGEFVPKDLKSLIRK
ncbi:MAG: nucleotidyl transferase AbiEii/AbiGii toxin family protein [Bdellovibrionales bacterium]|nr:nucleotidyl transferase AbiEii/AbiGii toxin family protein [Bdellovibrionales bacterium]